MGCSGCGRRVKAAANASLRTTPTHKTLNSSSSTVPVSSQVPDDKESSIQNLDGFTDEELYKVHTI